MNTKLTLRLDDQLIEAAKKHAEANGKSLSKLVADFFSTLDKEKTNKTPANTPTVLLLRGMLKGADISEDDYRKHLEEKYL